jgi:hypothetical protein
MISPGVNSFSTKSIKLALLLMLNIIWNGLGNVAVGDERGWIYVFINVWLFIFPRFVIHVGLLGYVPILGYYAYCGFKGYKYISKSTKSPSVDVPRLIFLLAVNILWNGLGSVGEGDRRGWKFVFINVVVIMLIFFTWEPILFILALSLYGLCGFQGYNYLENHKRQRLVGA